MSTSKPAIVLVPGAWHGPIHYQPLTSRLEQAGYEVHSLDLPCTAEGATDDVWKDDVALVRSTVEGLADREKDVVVVMHSRGGIVGADAVEGMSKIDQRKARKQGGVAHLLYMCAFAAPEKVSLFEATKGPDEWIQFDGRMAYPTKEEEIFYNDVSAAEIEEARKHIKPMPRSCFEMHKAKYAAWKHIPSTYLVCEKDNGIPLPAQEAMIKHPAAKFKVERCQASHSPFLSMPDFTAEVVRRAAGEQI